VLQPVPPDREHPNLSDRAALVPDIGVTLNDMALTSISELFERCHGTLIADGAPGLLDEIARFRACRHKVHYRPYSLRSNDVDGSDDDTEARP